MSKLLKLSIDLRWHNENGPVDAKDMTSEEREQFSNMLEVAAKQLREKTFAPKETLEVNG